MRRRIIILGLLLLFLGATSWGIYGLLWTPEGVGWIFKALSRYSSLTISAEKISGRLAGRLELQGVRAFWSEGRLTIEKLQTRLRPLHLLRGTIFFEEIRLRGFSIQDRGVKTEPLDLSLPRISGIMTRLAVDVRSFSLEEIGYQRLHEPTRMIKSLAGRLSFRQGILAVDPLRLEGDFGRLQGRLGLGFNVPSLWLDANYLPRKAVFGMDQVVIQGRLTPVWGPEQMAGPLSLTGRSGKQERILIRTQLAVGPHHLNLRRISFQEKGRKGLVRGQGSVKFDQAGPVFQGLLNLEDLDLSREISAQIRLSGALGLAGRPGAFGGTFDLKNQVRSWTDFRLSGSYQGGTAGLKVRLVRGEWLGGALEGRADIGWDKGISLFGDLYGREIKPENLHPRWPGLINLKARGKFYRPEAGKKQIFLSVDLLESRFQGRELKGGIKGYWDQDSLKIDRAELSGRGFGFSGQGVLSQGLDFRTRVDDLAALLPGSRGALSAGGWIRWRKGRFGGRISLEGKDIFWREMGAGGLNLEAALDQEKPDTALDLEARVSRPVYRSWAADYFSGQVRGTLSAQKAALFLNGLPGKVGKVRAGLEGAYHDRQWEGRLVSFSGEVSQEGAFRLESPAVILLGIDRFRLAPCRISGNSGEGLDLSADLELDPLSGSLSMGWQGIDPDLFRSYLKGFRPAGRTTGLIKAKILDQGRMDLLARGDFRGSLEIEGRKVDLARSSLNLAWDGLGLRADFDLQTSRQARFWGRAESEEKGHPAFPERGKVSAQWTGLDIDQLLPQRPAALQTRGQLRGRIEGEWSKGPSFNLKGGVSLAGGSLSWKEKGDSLTALVKKGEAGFQWRAEGLKGDLVLEMERHGRINGDFHLPLPARFPLRLKPAGPLEIRLQADLQEKGLMTALWPEAKLSGQGRIKGNVSARGTWERPSFEGDLELTEPGADLAPLGLRVRDITARASFSQDRIIINSLIMHSGPGQLNGRGALRLKDWKIAEIEGRLFGRDFQAVNRTDIQALASPDLTFSGPPGKLSVQGVLEIPQALISGGQPQGFKRASPDLRIIDSPALSLKERVFPIQGEIRLVLGRKVRLKADGLEGLLRGSLGLKIKNSRDISATGEIGIVEGTYLLQGQKLRVTQGRFSFSGPPDNPLIDMIALRSIRRQQRLEEGVDEVQAGIVVTGRIGSPLVKLYSRPPMPEGDILSYILFGEPLKQGTGQQELALLGKAAKTLLGRGMPGELSGLIDLDTLEVRSEGADFSSSVVTVGKYLDPRLYLGLGGSLFSNSYQVILRYSLTPHLEIETKGGTQSGGGIYFKMEFE